LVNKLRDSNRLALFTDAKNRATPASSWMKDPWICWTPNLAGTGRVTLADAWENTGQASDKSMFDLNRHNGRMNVAFADGHVEAVDIDKDSLSQVMLLPN
jgi:prepilin-type processing-associated H-X9-DG protein